MNRLRFQSGVAIITAILVTTLAAVATYALTAELELDIRRTANLIDSDQAWLYAEGSEEWVRTVLADDLADNKFDHYGEPWAATLPPIELKGGFITGAVEDMQGRFNLNSLARAGDAGSVTLERFNRLLTLVGIDPALSQAVIDWLDDNVDPLSPFGAEDSYYLGLTPPYRAANRPMLSASELRLVRGFDDETYNKLAPFICALPAGTTINVNTAPAEVLAALDPNISLELAKRLVERRDSQPFESLSELTGDPLMKGIALKLQGLGVSTSYFMLRTEARIGAGRIRLNSLISRAPNQTRVWWRTPAQE